MTFDEKFTHILVIVGALVPLLSAVSSLLNHIIRVQSASGQAVSKALTTTASVVNFAAVNIDKGVQFAKMTRGLPVPETNVVNGVATPPAEAPKDPAAPQG